MDQNPDEIHGGLLNMCNHRFYKYGDVQFQKGAHDEYVPYSLKGREGFYGFGPGTIDTEKIEYINFNVKVVCNNFYVYYE